MQKLSNQYLIWFNSFRVKIVTVRKSRALFFCVCRGTWIHVWFPICRCLCKWNCVTWIRSSSMKPWFFNHCGSISQWSEELSNNGITELANYLWGSHLCLRVLEWQAGPHVCPIFYGIIEDVNSILVLVWKHFLLAISLPSTPSVIFLCEKRMWAEHVWIIQEQSMTS